jgi:hypothetical protein
VYSSRYRQKLASCATLWRLFFLTHSLARSQHKKKYNTMKRVASISFLAFIQLLPLLLLFVFSLRSVPQSEIKRKAHKKRHCNSFQFIVYNFFPFLKWVVYEARAKESKWWEIEFLLVIFSANYLNILWKMLPQLTHAHNAFHFMY